MQLGEVVAKHLQHLFEFEYFKKVLEELAVCVCRRGQLTSSCRACFVRQAISLAATLDRQSVASILSPS